VDDERTGERLGTELERSGKFARELERLRAAEQRTRRATPPFEDFPTVDAMREHVQASRQQPREQRAYKWSADRVERDTFDPAPSEPCADLERHARRLQTTAFYYLGATSAANMLLTYVRDASMGIPIPGAVASRPATVAVASCITARVHGWEWGSARRPNITFTRHVDVQLDDTWYFHKSIDGSES